MNKQKCVCETADVREVESCADGHVARHNIHAALLELSAGKVLVKSVDVVLWRNSCAYDVSQLVRQLRLRIIPKVVPESRRAAVESLSTMPGLKCCELKKHEKSKGRPTCRCGPCVRGR